MLQLLQIFIFEFQDNYACFLFVFYALFSVAEYWEKTQELKKQNLQKVEIWNSFINFSDREFPPKFESSPHIKIGQSTLDSASPDKFLEIPSYMPLFGEKD